MYYELKIYLYKSIHNITITCDEEFYGTILDALDNGELQFVNLNDVIIPKSSIKKIIIKTHEAKIKCAKEEK